MLTDAASRAELQHSLQLFLLGQRFGVLAGRPAFDVETLPVGPQALCRSIRRAAERLGLEVQVRLLLYRSFERQVMPAIRRPGGSDQREPRPKRRAAPSAVRPDSRPTQRAEFRDRHGPCGNPRAGAQPGRLRRRTHGACRTAQPIRRAKASRCSRLESRRGAQGRRAAAGHGLGTRQRQRQPAKRPGLRALAPADCQSPPTAGQAQSGSIARRTRSAAPGQRQRTPGSAARYCRTGRPPR